MKRAMAILGGIALLATGVAVGIHAARVSCAQYLYFQAKYGPLNEDVHAVLTASERAHALYGCNYRLCEWAAQSAFYAPASENWTDIQRKAATAEWVDTGLALNAHARMLNVLKTFLLVPESPRKALVHWQTYVDWHYWDAYNQALLVDLLARNGRYSEAMAALKITEGSPHYERARASLRAAWQRERQGF